MQNLDTSITSVSEEDFNSLFDEISEKQPTADTIVGGKETKPAVKAVKEDEVVKVGDGFGEVETVENLDDLLNEEDEDTTKEVEGKKVEKAPTDKTEEKVDDKETDDSEKPDKEAVKGILKNTVNYLVEKGLWLDFNGRDELEIDEEVYADLAAQQDEVRVRSMFNELVDTTGDYGKAIINFVKEGGNPDEIIDIFKEQKQIENFDTNSEDGKKALVTKYYKDVIGWKPEKIERHIKSLIANDELETETTDVKDLYDAHSKEELARVTQEQAQYQQEQKRREEAFKQNITGVISSRKDLSTKERKFIEDSILTYKNKLPDGNVVSDFYLKFAQIQADPQEYVELVEYVMNKQAYLKKMETKIDNKNVDKTFNFVKGNTALTTKKGSSHESVKRVDDKTSGFDFGLNLKK